MKGRSISPSGVKFGAKLAEMSTNVRYGTHRAVGNAIIAPAGATPVVATARVAIGNATLVSPSLNDARAAIAPGALSYREIETVLDAVPLAPGPDDDMVFTVRCTGSPATGQAAAATAWAADVNWFVDPGPTMTIVADGGTSWVPSNAMRVHEYFKTSIRDFRRAATWAFTNRRGNEPPPSGYQPGNFGLWLPFDCEVPHPTDVDFEFVCEPSPKAQALGAKAVSFVVKSEWLAPGPPTKSSRRGLRKVLARAIGLATRALFRRLRRCITHLVRLEGLHRLREFVGKQRPWHLLHGAHPPRFLALEHFALFGSNVPGTLA
jgi:hypothetical protein